MKRTALLILATCSLLNSFAQTPPSWTSAEMYQAIRKLNVLGSVLYVAAHPDDENTRLISWLSKDRLYRTGYLSITRGDGGQNLIGDEQGIDLGLIRTQELLAARRVDGGEQFFTRAYDFGYSKNPEETFIKWNKEKILADVVWVIRNFRPDVIITRFPTTGEGGHGHHTASAILANEAFTAAADPNRFPEQLKLGVQPWKVKRILWNTFSFGGTNTQSSDQFKFDVGGYNPLLGKSYGEIAAASRSQHKSQGFGVAAGRGEALEYFRTTGGTAPTNDLMDDVDLSWQKIPGGELIQRMVDSIAGSFDFLRPERSVPALVRVYQQISALAGRDSYWTSVKLKETKELIRQCSGLFLDATTTQQFAVQGDSLRINLSFNNRLGSNIHLRSVTVLGSRANVYVEDTANRRLERNRNLNLPKNILVHAEEKITQPYWLLEKKEEGYFNVPTQLYIGQPDVHNSLTMVSSLSIEGTAMDIETPVRYKFTDPVRGELYEPLVVMPSILVAPDESVKASINSNQFSGILKFTTKSRRINQQIRSVSAGDGNAEKNFSPSSLTIQDPNTEYEMSYRIKGSADNEYTFRINDGRSNATGSSSGPDFEGKGLREIKYDHIPYINYFVPASVKNVRINLETYNKKIAYIPGAGDKVIEALEQMGYEVNRLTEKEISKNDLEKFDAIITGVRAYNTNEWLNKHYDKLMKYVEKGGNLIVQYNTSNQIGPVRAKISPYPFTISRTRITDENAEVRILKPAHPVFNFPNRITPDDFKGWIQERSIYHASAFDSTKFETLISMNDPGEKADEGSLIIAKHGKGYFTYTGLVFFRQLPAGVPGAYRLLANLIALNRKKGF